MRNAMTMHSGRNDAATAPNLLEDQRGAVMLTGLFMAMCLIGALWYVIGIGDALIFRDRMQEAADSAAFTGAVMNAKGMNFISVCNIVMLLLVIVYLVFAVLQDATILTCLACAFACIPCCGACFYVIQAINLNQRVARVVKTGLNVMTALEAAAAIGYPWMGTMRANEVGNTYKVRENQHSTAGDTSKTASVWALGMTNIPAVGGRWAGPIPLGLPVEGKEYAELCSKVAEDLMSLLTGLITGPGRGSGAGGPLNKLGNAIGKLVGAFVKLRYCNDLSGGALSGVTDMFNDVRGELANGTNQTQTTTNPDGTTTTTTINRPPDANAANQINTGGPQQAPNPDASWNGWSPWFDPGFDKGWGDKGYLVPHASAGNGRQPHQIWAINRNPEYNDEFQKNVSFGAHTRDRAFDSTTQAVTPQGWGYFAQAEFYFDCEEAWDGEDCNEDDNAAFSVRWRARLVRVQMFSLASMLQQFLFNSFGDIIGDAVESAVGGLIGNLAGRIPGGQQLAESAIGRAVIDTASGLVQEQVVDPLLGMLQGQLDRLSSSISPTTIEGAYH